MLGPSPWFSIKLGKVESASVFADSLGQLMLQSWCCWSTFPTQEQVYLKLLTGPFITVIKFHRPPTAFPGLLTNPCMEQADSSSRPKKRRRLEEGDEEEMTTPLHELIPYEYAPKLVIWNRHIFMDPYDSTQGLSVELRYALHCTTKDIIKGFDQGLQMEKSSVFDFAGFADHPFEEGRGAKVI